MGSTPQIMKHQVWRRSLFAYKQSLTGACTGLKVENHWSNSLHYKEFENIIYIKRTIEVKQNPFIIIRALWNQRGPVSSLRGCLGHPNIQIWASPKEKAGNKQPIEYGAGWNYNSFVKCCGFRKNLFSSVEIFVIENMVMEMLEIFGIYLAFSSDKNKGKV